MYEILTHNGKLPVQATKKKKKKKIMKSSFLSVNVIKQHSCYNLKSITLTAKCIQINCQVSIDYNIAYAICLSTHFTKIYFSRYLRVEY